MKRHTSSTFWRKAGALALAAASFGGATAIAKPAAAQEIQMTGPLAGASSTRKLRLRREGRFELALGSGFTLLDEYQRTIFLAGRVQYNPWDFLGIGVFGGFGLASLPTDLTEKVNSTAPRNTRTEINIPGKGGNFADQTSKLKWMAGPQVTFSPFRGKLAVFQKLFVDTDLYIHAGVAAVNIEERADCTVCTTAASFKTNTRIGVAPTFGLGLTLYTWNAVNINLEYRAFPILSGTNRGGFDSRGSGPDGNFPDNKISSEDRTFKFNQMVFIGFGFDYPFAPKVSD